MMTPAFHLGEQNGFRCASRIQELAQHSQLLTDWALRYDQISHGRFEGSLKEAWLDGVQFYQEQLSQSVFQRGQGRTGTLCLGVFNALSGEARWMGNSLTQQDITWSYDGDELILQTPETSSLLVLSIPLALLSDITDELPHRVYAIHHDLLANRLREHILAMLHSVMEHPLQFAQRQARLQFLSDIRELAFAFFTAVGTQTISVRPSLQKAQRVVTKAQDALIAHRDRPLTMDELCQLTHTSRRTLQNCFETVTGQSPAVFLKNMRLNGVKRMLVMEGEYAQISEIASKWGFWHLSQFTADYKRLFAKLPSHTRRAVHHLI
ncbi:MULTISPECIES: helix-turn-helix domain-containing protein [Symbiopectobacterium]|uniref:helix-turn-helix domain-containing protein n=1 Tax=Symbiopectobacterium TaxID=801 RepID=UPI001A2BEEA6|nr:MULTISPECIES: helix-turn-helix domain-containing protein [Symbiopectobacterium]MBG6249324.1 helix-turn-helix domain-containing protein [Candidatus Symbiopectobacterium sp. PLON1]MBT9430662.1 helix-turn-helix domain-containing protein [Candidatus Symbiopectobacterium endolongispinus]